MIRRTALVMMSGMLAVAAPARAQDAHAGHADATQHGGMMMCMMPGMEHGAGMQGQAGGQAMQHGAGMHGQAAMGAQHAQAGHMGGYIANPGMLLHHRTDLALTADQVRRIEALQALAQTECEQHMKLAQEKHVAAAAALEAQTPDVAAFEARLREAAQHMVQAHVAAARRGVEALNVLSAEQRAKLKSGEHEDHRSGH